MLQPSFKLMMLLVLMGGYQLFSQVIVSDSFTGTGEGVALSGHALETSLSGGGWVKPTAVAEFVSTSASGFGNGIPGATAKYQNASAVSIQSAGGYLKPSEFIIRADLSPQTIAGSATSGRGLALGFFSAVGSGGFSQNLFTGLVLDASGSLGLVQDPNAGGFFDAGSTVGTSIAFGGVFNPTSFYTLSYTVNTTSGTISNISLLGSTADYSSLQVSTLFTDAATAYAGFYASSTSGAVDVALDNFQIIASVPESNATIFILLSAPLLLFGFLKRKHRSSVRLVF